MNKGLLPLSMALLLVYELGCANAEMKTSRILLMEDAGQKKWCAFSDKSAWNKAVQQIGAAVVGALLYDNGDLTQIDVTETDESGDWTAYDHYYVDPAEQITRLVRMINVLPGDQSVVQTFAISGGKFKLLGKTSTQLSTHAPVISTDPLWIPDLPIRTTLKKFPFHRLFVHLELGAGEEVCAPAEGT